MLIPTPIPVMKATVQRSTSVPRVTFVAATVIAIIVRTNVPMNSPLSSARTFTTFLVNTLPRQRKHLFSGLGSDMVKGRIGAGTGASDFPVSSSLRSSLTRGFSISVILRRAISCCNCSNELPRNSRDLATTAHARMGLEANHVRYTTAEIIAALNRGWIFR